MSTSSITWILSRVLCLGLLNSWAEYRKGNLWQFYVLCLKAKVSYSIMKIKSKNRTELVSSTWPPSIQLNSSQLSFQQLHLPSWKAQTTTRTQNSQVNVWGRRVKALVAQSSLTLGDPVDCSPPDSMEFSRQEYWSGLPFPSPGNLPDPGIELRSPVLQADSFPSGKPMEGQEY